MDEKKPGCNRASLYYYPPQKMDKQTLPHRAELCREHSVRAISHSRDGLTVREIQRALQGKCSLAQREIRAALDELVDDEILDYEEWECGGPKYFLLGRPPRPLRRFVAPGAAPSLVLAQRGWCSALGVAA
jgi:hypothetical protein